MKHFLVILTTDNKLLKTEVCTYVLLAHATSLLPYVQIRLCRLSVKMVNLMVFCKISRRVIFNRMSL